MPLRLRCTCGKVLKADSSMAGKRGRCKKCGHTFTVPKTDEAKLETTTREVVSPQKVASWLAEGEMPAVAIYVL